jgi:hypothetical protein
MNVTLFTQCLVIQIVKLKPKECTVGIILNSENSSSKSFCETKIITYVPLFGFNCNTLIPNYRNIILRTEIDTITYKRWVLVKLAMGYL